MRRTIAIAALFALAAPTLAMAQGNTTQQNHGGPPHPAPHLAPPPHLGPPPGPPPGGAPQLRPVPHLGGPPPGAPGLGAVPHLGPGLGGPLVGVHPGLPGPFPGRPVGPPGQFAYRGHFMPQVHLAPFIYPPGWAYREWAVGAMLPPLFLAPDYYYPEWAALGLEPPPPGCQWVRYGPDLLLVDVATGQVLDVAYGVFS
jgi:Nickel/cobalt transporter regulator